MPDLVATTTGGVTRSRRRWHRCPALGRAPRSSPAAAQRGAEGAGLEGGAPRPRQTGEGHASAPIGHCPTDRVPTFTCKLPIRHHHPPPPPPPPPSPPPPAPTSPPPPAPFTPPPPARRTPPA